MKIQGREARRRGLYIPLIKAGIHPVLRNTPKKYASRYYQLNVRDGAVGAYLTRIRVIETSKCSWSKDVLQSVEYLFTKCRGWRKQRRNLVREQEKKGISWQTQGERKWVAGLLGNEKAVAPLLDNRRGREKRSQRKGVRMGAEK